MVDLFFIRQLGAIDGLPIDRCHEIVGAIALVFLEQHLLAGD